MAVIIEYPDTVAARQLALLNMPFPDLVKYCVLSVSLLLLLLALIIFLWQLLRCCQQTNAAPHTSDYYLESSTTPDFLVAPRTMDLGMDYKRRSRCIAYAGNGDAIRELEDPREKKVSGSLRFIVFYEPPPQSRLVVTILQAEGLPRRSQAHKPHPFVRLRLMWAGQEDQEEGSGSLMMKKKKKEEEASPQGAGPEPPRALCAVLREWTTRMVRDTCSPAFGEQFSCEPLQQHDLPRVTLRMEVKDFDKFSRHMVLGEVRVPLRHLDICYPLELQEHLQMPQKDPVGEVLLSLKFLPAAQRLEVGLLKIRTLQTNTNTDTALYARISVQGHQCRLRHQKTTAVRQCQTTVFNQVLMFSLLEFPPRECNVAISVYETDADRKHKHLVGQLSVGKDERCEDHHWTLMMRSLRQPIALWHQLLI